MKAKFKALILTLIVQAIMAMLFFIGGLMDPLLIVYVAIFYFLVIGSFLTFKVIYQREDIKNGK